MYIAIGASPGHLSGVSPGTCTICSLVVMLSVEHAMLNKVGSESHHVSGVV